MSTGSVQRTGAERTGAERSGAERSGDRPAAPEDYLELNLGGMTCAACAARVERTLNKLEGVRASVNFATERAFVTGLPAALAPRAVEAIERAGYSAVGAQRRGRHLDRPRHCRPALDAAPPARRRRAARRSPCAT